MSIPVNRCVSSPAENVQSQQLSTQITWQWIPDCWSGNRNAQLPNMLKLTYTSMYLHQHI